MPESQQEGKDSVLTQDGSHWPQARGCGQTREAPASTPSPDSSRVGLQGSPSPSPSTQSKQRERSVKKNRRPDQQLYVPRSRRQSQEPDQSLTSKGNPKPSDCLPDSDNVDTSSTSPSSQIVQTQKCERNSTPSKKKLKLEAKESKRGSYSLAKTLNEETPVASSASKSSLNKECYVVNSASNEQNTKSFSGERSQKPVCAEAPAFSAVEKVIVNKEHSSPTDSTIKEGEQQQPEIFTSREKTLDWNSSTEVHGLPVNSIQERTLGTISEAKLVNKTAPLELKHLCGETLIHTISNRGKGEQGSSGIDQPSRELYTREVQETRSALSVARSMAKNVSVKDSTSMSAEGDKKSAVLEAGKSQVMTDSVGKKEQEMKEDEKVDGAGKEEEEEEEGDSWDTMFDDEGNSLKEEEIKEITDAVGGVSIAVKKPAHEYYSFSPKDTTDYSKLEHVIEAFDFPASFQTQDLVMSFSAFKSKGFDIKWVDDTHALVIFASAQVAEDALCLQNPMLRTRPLSLASKQSKQKAREEAGLSLQPYRPRPETSATAARRMVAGALGLKTNVSKEERAAERQKLKEARDKKREEKRQKSDVWEGNI